MDIFKERSKCIFCNSNITTNYFINNKNLFISSNICDKKDNNKLTIPYNIAICTNCGCFQNKY